MKKWLTEQIGYLEKTKANPDKFTWDPEYDYQLAAFRLALERLEPVGPLTLDQLREMERPTPAWAEVEGKTIEGWDGYWCLCQNGKILAPSRLVIQAECMDGVEFYAHPPTHIDREAWVSVSERMPDEDQVVIVIANGKPRENINLNGAFELAEWSERDGWVLECWPEWETPVVTHWMPLPEPPEREG